MNRQMIHYIKSKISRSKLGLFILIIVAMITSLAGVAFALLTKYIVDAAVNQDSRLLFIIAFALALLIVLQVLMRALQVYMTAYLRGKIEIRLREDTYKAILHKDMMATESYHSGELVNRLASDVAQISEVIDLIPRFVFYIFRFVAAFGVLFFLDVVFAVIMIGFGAVLFLASRFYGQRMKTRHKAHQESEGRLRSFWQESLGNLTMIKSFSAEDYMMGKADDKQIDLFTQKMARTKLSLVANIGVFGLFSVGYLFALVYGSYSIFIGTLTFGSLTALLQLVQHVQSPISGLSLILPKYYGMMASAERLHELETLKEDISSIVPENAHNVYLASRFIKFDNVSFSYGDKVVFERFNLHINKGDFILISGLSGIGKTTLLKMLLGLIRPTEGAVYIHDDERMLLFDKHLRKMFAYVPQGNMVVSGTLRENITFGLKEVTDEAIMAACKVAVIDQFIADLPKGLDTVVGERGLGLSEGQSQRIAIARAVLKKAHILLLDEATSALDSDTERQVLHQLKKLDKTIILVSHRDVSKQLISQTVRLGGEDDDTHLPN